MLIPKRQFVASIDVHAQYTFTSECPDELPVMGGTEIVPELNAQAILAGYRIGTKEAHNAHAMWIASKKHPQLTPISGENVDVRWKPHAMPGTKGFELIQGLPKVTDYDYFVWEGIELDMHPYGVCFHDHAEKLSTGLIEFLQSKNVNTVIVGGLATDYCVKQSAFQLARAGFRTIVNLGACRSISAETEQKALEIMKAFGVEFVSSANELQNEE